LLERPRIASGISASLTKPCALSSRRSIPSILPHGPAR
jgi:hypothetical protein